MQLAKAVAGWSLTAGQIGRNAPDEQSKQCDRRPRRIPGGGGEQESCGDGDFKPGQQWDERFHEPRRTKVAQCLNRCSPVRELRNTIERLVVSSRGSVIEALDLPDPVLAVRPRPDDLSFSNLTTLDDLERRYLLHVLDAANGNRTRAAEILGIDRRTLYRMAARFGIELKE